MTKLIQRVPRRSLLRFHGINLEGPGPNLYADDLKYRRKLPTHQSTPRNIYVYAHVDAEGSIFYIGQGSDRRAWSRDRDKLWRRYVDAHLKGRYTVQVLADCLSQVEADELESRWMDQENEGLINLQNMARRIDHSALRCRDKLMAQNKAVIAEARALKNTNREKAIELYKEALALLKQFAGIPIETGLYARVLAEHVAENGPIGQISLLDRLTLCLVRAGRAHDARLCAEDYFGMFKGEHALVTAERIMKRIKRDNQARNRSA